MGAKYCAFTVVLGQDVTLEDSREISRLLRMIKGVVEVCPVKADMPHYIAKAQAMAELRRQMLQMLYPREAEQLAEAEEPAEG
jgi:hypothetical protein